MSSVDLQLTRCGCCEPPAPATPLRVDNRPSLDAVAYRAGSYAGFRQAMIQLLPRMAAELAHDLGLAEPPLIRWTSRRSDDYGIALIEMWATIADILTFYTERYANEAWLRTADHRDSIRRLAGLLGYRLKPGVAAATHLGYTLDNNVTLTLPPGLRVQSVPQHGERPQKFETSTALEATAALNRVPVYGTPHVVKPLLAGRTGATLAPESVVPVPGDPVLLFTSGASGVEERTVTTVDTVDGRSVLRWSAPLHAARGEAHLRGRAFRLFGHNAPVTHLAATPQGKATAQSVNWEQAATDFMIDSSTGIDLDGTVDGIEIGGDVLIVASGDAHHRTITHVEHVRGVVAATTQNNDTVEVMAGAATRITVDGPAITLNRATTRVYELANALGFLGWDLPHTPIPAGKKTIYLPYPEVGKLAKGRLLVLDDHRADPMLAEVAADAKPFTVAGANPEFLKVELVGGTARQLDPTTVHLRGNVVAATHGETIRDEIVGDGDASHALQEFTLAKAPVTHTADPTAPGGARSTLQVLIDRILWAGQPGLFGAGPADRSYTTWIDDEQKMRIRFGDGRSGARLPSGRGNVLATYRQGLGVQGNLDAGQLATALDKPTGVSAVTNPLPATGGVDPETTGAARENAPNTVRTFGRVVSLRDFADLAREYTGIEKAFATWVWDGEERVVHVTVGGEDGAKLSAGQLTAVRTYLDQRRDPNRALRLDQYRPVPFLVSVSVQAAPDRVNEDVHAAVLANLVGYFAYPHRRFGQAVHLSDIYAVVHEAGGVVSARVEELRYKRFTDRITHGAWFTTVAIRARIVGARPLSSGKVSPAELASLEDPADAEVTVSGGLES